MNNQQIQHILFRVFVISVVFSPILIYVDPPHYIDEFFFSCVLIYFEQPPCIDGSLRR